MAFQFKLYDPTGTLTDITTKVLASNLPDLTLTIENDFAEFVAGDMSFDVDNSDTWFSTAFSAVNPEDHYDFATAKGCWTIEVYKASTLRWVGDLDPRQISFDTKQRTCSFTALGILKRFDHYNAEKVQRTIPRYSDSGTCTIGAMSASCTTTASYAANALVNHIFICNVSTTKDVFVITGNTATVAGVTAITLANPANSTDFPAGTLTAGSYIINPFGFKAQDATYTDQDGNTVADWSRRKMTSPIAISTLTLTPRSGDQSIKGDIIRFTKLKIENGKVEQQDLEIQDTHATDATLSVYEVRMVTRTRVRYTSDCGQVCQSPWWKNLSTNDMLVKLFTYCGLSAGQYEITYTAFSNDLIECMDTSGKNVNEAVTELAAIVGAVWFATPSKYYFIGRDQIKSGNTTKVIDSLVMEEAPTNLWEKFYNFISVEGSVQKRIARKGGLVYPENKLEIKTDYVSQMTWLQAIATRAYSLYGVRRHQLDLTVADDGTAYQLWDQVTRNSTVYYVLAVTEPMRSVDATTLSSIGLTVIEKAGLAATTGDGETDDQSIDNSDPPAPSAFTVYKVDGSEPAAFRTLYPKADYPTQVDSIPQVVPGSSPPAYVTYTRQLYCLQFKWDNDDLHGRLLGFHLTKWKDGKTRDKPISQDVWRDPVIGSDGYYYWPPEHGIDEGGAPGGPVYVRVGKKRWWDIEAVVEGGRGQSNTSPPCDPDSNIKDEAPPPAVPGGLFIGSNSGTSGTGGVWSSVKNVPAWVYLTNQPSTAAYNRVWEVHCGNGNIYVAGIYAGYQVIRKSLDQGVTWNNAMPGGGSQELTGAQQELCVSRVDDVILASIVVSGVAGTYWSHNGGATWTKATGIPANSTGIYMSDSRSDIVWAFDGSGLWKSTDSGQSFTLISAGLGQARLTIDPTNANIVYRSTGSGLFISTDGGATWGTNKAPASVGNISDLAIDPTNNSRIYLANQGGGNYYGIYVATTGSAVAAADWAAVGLYQKVVLQLRIDPNNALNLYAKLGNSSGRFAYSIDRGTNWTYMSETSAPDATVLYFALDVLGDVTVPPQGGTILGLWGNTTLTPNRIGCSTTADHGFSWADGQYAQRTIIGPYLWAAYDPALPAVCYLLVENGTAYRTSNGGASWELWGPNLGSGIGFNPEFLEVALAYVGTAAYLVDTNGVLWRTADRTTTNPAWSICTPSGCVAVSVVTDWSNPLYVHVLGSDGKVYTSSDSGATYGAGVASGFNATKGKSQVKWNGVLWVIGTRDAAGGQNYVIRKSTDNGATFSTPTDPDASITGLKLGGLYVDPSNPASLILASGTGKYGLARSTDTGGTWAWVLYGDATSGHQMWNASWVADQVGGMVACGNGGAWFSTDSGATWLYSDKSGTNTGRKWYCVAAAAPAPPIVAFTTNPAITWADIAAASNNYQAFLNGTTLTATLPLIDGPAYKLYMNATVQLTNLNATNATVQGTSGQYIGNSATATLTTNQQLIVQPALGVGGVFYWRIIALG